MGLWRRRHASWNRIVIICLQASKDNHTSNSSQNEDRNERNAKSSDVMISLLYHCSAKNEERNNHKHCDDNKLRKHKALS
jgi:hypothetical protein